VAIAADRIAIAADKKWDRQRIVLAAIGAEPVRKAEELFLVYRTQHCGCRPLDDFVFEGSNRDWSLSAI
jgi:hypothetical protein